jgi:hypothetical protein
MINEIYTFDNIVDIKIQNEIENYVYNKNLQWNIEKNITNSCGIHTNYLFPAIVHGELNIDKNILKFIDIIINNSLNKINKKLAKKYRIKINKTIPHHIDTNEEYRLLHIDKTEPHVTIIYYINDSDGDTLIFNDKNNKHLKNINEFMNNENFLDFKNFELNKCISPKKGRVVIFDGNLWHYGKYPTKGERNIININLVIVEDVKSII